MTENLIINYFKDADYFVTLSDITSCLFLIRKLKNPTYKKQQRKWNRKKSLAKKMIRKMLQKQIIEVDNEFLKSYKLLNNE